MKHLYIFSAVLSFIVGAICPAFMDPIFADNISKSEHTTHCHGQDELEKKEKNVPEFCEHNSKEKSQTFFPEIKDIKGSVFPEIKTQNTIRYSFFTTTNENQYKYIPPPLGHIYKKSTVLNI